MVSGYSVVTVTSSPTAGWSATQSSGRPSSAATGTWVLRRPSRMPREKACSRSVSRSLERRAAARGSRRRGRRRRAGSRAGSSPAPVPPPSSSRAGVDRDQRGVHVGVEHQVGAELLGLHHVALGLLAQARRRGAPAPSGARRARRWRARCRAGSRRRAGRRYRPTSSARSSAAGPGRSCSGRPARRTSRRRGRAGAAAPETSRPQATDLYHLSGHEPHPNEPLAPLALRRGPRMSTHIGAEAGAIAPHVLMPGDPLRARWIAETFLEDATCYNEVRGMLGLHRHLAGPAGQRAGLGHGPAVVRDLRQRAVQRLRRAVGGPGRLVRRAGREGRRPRRHPRLRRLHRLRDEPAPLPRPRLRPGGRLRPAAGGVRRGAASRRRRPCGPG